MSRLKVGESISSRFYKQDPRVCVVFKAASGRLYDLWDLTGGNQTRFVKTNKMLLKRITSVFTKNAVSHKLVGWSWWGFEEWEAYKCRKLNRMPAEWDSVRLKWVWSDEQVALNPELGVKPFRFESLSMAHAFSNEIGG